MNVLMILLFMLEVTNIIFSLLFLKISFRLSGHKIKRNKEIPMFVV